MSDAPAAPVQENGVPPVAQDSRTSTVAPGFKVFAGNLAYSTTDEGLKAFFAPVEGDILSAQIIKRRSRNGFRSAGYGFVALITIEAAQQAVEALNNTELDGRTVIVEIAKPAEEKSKDPRPPRKPRRRFPSKRGPRSAPAEASDAEPNGEITDKAEAAPGTEGAEKPKKKKKKTHRRNRAKSSEAEAPAPADDAPTTDRAEDPPKQRSRRPRARRPPRPAGEDPIGEPSKTVLFVANLGFNLDDAGLAAIFTDAGLEVVSARIARKGWGNPGRSKGYGFVTVTDEAEQKKAIDALQGKEVGGRVIVVKVAVDHSREDDATRDATDDKTPDAVVIDAA